MTCSFLETWGEIYENSYLMKLPSHTRKPQSNKETVIRIRCILLFFFSDAYYKLRGECEEFSPLRLVTDTFCFLQWREEAKRKAHRSLEKFSSPPAPGMVGGDSTWFTLELDLAAPSSHSFTGGLNLRGRKGRVDNAVMGRSRRQQQNWGHVTHPLRKISDLLQEPEETENPHVILGKKWIPDICNF